MEIHYCYPIVSYGYSKPQIITIHVHTVSGNLVTVILITCGGIVKPMVTNVYMLRGDKNVVWFTTLPLFH